MNPYAAIFAAVVLAVGGYQFAQRTDGAGAANGQTAKDSEDKKEGGGSPVPFLDQLFGSGQSYLGNEGSNSFDAGWAGDSGVDYTDTGPSATVPPPTTREYVSSDPGKVLPTPSAQGPSSAHHAVVSATGYGGKLGVFAQ